MVWRPSSPLDTERLAMSAILWSAGIRRRANRSTNHGVCLFEHAREHDVRCSDEEVSTAQYPQIRAQFCIAIILS